MALAAQKVLYFTGNPLVTAQRLGRQESKRPRVARASEKYDYIDQRASKHVQPSQVKERKIKRLHSQILHQILSTSDLS